MKLLVDTNILFSAVLRDGTTRRILVLASIEFLAPEHVMEEITEHLDEVCAKNRLPLENNLAVLDRMLRHIKLVPTEDIVAEIPHAKQLFDRIDIDDAPVLAAALSVDCDGIWSEDPHLQKQNLVKIWRTKDLLQFIK